MEIGEPLEVRKNDLRRGTFLEWIDLVPSKNPESNLLPLLDVGASDVSKTSLMKPAGANKNRANLGY